MVNKFYDASQFLIVNILQDNFRIFLVFHFNSQIYQSTVIISPRIPHAITKFEIFELSKILIIISVTGAFTAHSVPF